MTHTNRIAVCAVLAASLAAAGCTKHEQPAAQPAASAAAAEPSPVQLEKVVIQSFHVDPATIRRDQSATASVTLAGAPAGTLLTLAWFGPEGWLAFDQQEPVNGSNAAFSIPGATFAQPGVYHGSLDAGAVHLGDATLTVTG